MAETKDQAPDGAGRLARLFGAPDGTTWSATVRTVLVLIVGPLLAGKVIADRFGFTGPWFNVDFAAFCIIMMLGARRGLKWLVWLAYAGIVASFAIRVAVGIGVIYLVDPIVVK